MICCRKQKSSDAALTYSHDDLTQNFSEGPADQNQLQGDERQAGHAQHVGHRQVEDVDVGDRLHFGVAEDDVDHQRVAAQSHRTHQEGDEGDDHRAGPVLLMAAAAGGVEGRLIGWEVGIVEEGVWDGEVGGGREDGPLIHVHNSGLQRSRGSERDCWGWRTQDGGAVLRRATKRTFMNMKP